MLPLGWTAVPIVLLRFLVMTQFAGGRDWHPHLLLLLLVPFLARALTGVENMVALVDYPRTFLWTVPAGCLVACLVPLKQKPLQVE